MENTQEIIDIISDYSNDRVTEYSIMITGKWGTGKTHFLKNHIEPKVSREILYVSLNGVNNLDEIDKLIIISLYPILEKKAVKALGGLASTALKYFKLDGFKDIIDLKDLPKNLSNKLLCFDDLERAKIDIEQLLGYINKFVEHMSVKTLLICNERKIQDNEKYKEIKEKLIGITISYLPNHQQIIDDLIKEYRESESEFCTFLESNRDILFEIFKKSESENIRILKQAVIYFSKIFNALSKEQRVHFGISSVFRFHLSTFFEVRTGSFDEIVFEKYINNPESYWMAKYFNEDTKNVKTYAEVFIDKYFEGKESNLIAFPSISTFIKTGHLPKEQLIKDMNEKFSDTEPEMSKIQFLTQNYWALSDDDFENACNEVIDKVKCGYEFSQTQYLNLFYRFLYFSKKGFLPIPSTELLDLFISGIDVAKDKWKFQNIDISHIMVEEPKDSEYHSFRQHLDKLNENLETKSKAEKVKKLIELSKSDFPVFIDHIRSSKSSEYLTIPIFQYWAPNDLVEFLSKLSNPELVEFFQSIKHRYSIGNTAQYYIGEIDNLQKIIAGITEYTNKKPSKLSSIMMKDLSEELDLVQDKLTKYNEKNSQQVILADADMPGC